jgi:hypothetical protein
MERNTSSNMNVIRPFTLHTSNDLIMNEHLKINQKNSIENPVFPRLQSVTGLA